MWKSHSEIKLISDHQSSLSFKICKKLLLLLYWISSTLCNRLFYNNMYYNMQPSFMLLYKYKWINIIILNIYIVSLENKI